MATVSLNSANPATTPSTQTPVGSSKLGKDEFVKLMMAQLAHQDPTSPQDNQAFVAQLAQFAGVELMQNTNADLENLLMAQAAANQTGATQLVGKDVVFKTDHVDLKSGQSTALDLQVDTSAKDVVVIIKDKDGNVVRTQHLGAVQSGDVDYTWDGRDDKGNPLPDGEYSVSVSALDDQNKAHDVSVGAKGHVDGVSFANGAPELMIGSLKVSLNDVVAVSEADAGSGSGASSVSGTTPGAISTRTKPKTLVPTGP